MTRSPLPADLRRFILHRIPSVPFLEALLLLHRQAPAHLSVDEVARALYLREPFAAELLAALEAQGLAQSQGEGQAARFSFLPESTTLATAVDELAAYYASHLIEVTQLIHDETQRNAAQFADAFKLRKDR